MRSICKKFEDRGLPNFPAGIPFTFWEQYLKLRFFLFLALACVLVAVFLVLCVALMSIWAATLSALVLASIVVELFGVLGLLGIKLSAAPAVILIMAVGVGVDFNIHVLVVSSLPCSQPIVCPISSDSNRDALQIGFCYQHWRT